MHRALRPFLPLLAGVAMACSDTTIKAPIPDPVPPPGVFDYCNEKVNGHDVYVDNAVQRGEVVCRRGRAEAAVYGTSITSEFRLKEGDFPKGSIHSAFNEPWDDLEKKSVVAHDPTIPPPVRGVLNVENTKVLARYKERCPTYFAREAMWTPTELRWSYASHSSGSHDPGQDWNFEGRYLATGAAPSAVNRIPADRRGKSYAQTEEEATGTSVGELGDLENLSADAMELQTNPSRNYLNHLLAHEMGHWTFTQIGWEGGRFGTQTKFFAEVTASWIASLCYFNPIEKPEYRKWMREDKDSLGNPNPVVNRDVQSPIWPALRSPSDYDTDVPILRSEGAGEALQYYNAGWNIAILYYAMHELNGPQDPNRLFGITLEAIKKMKGRKMECYDKTWCAGADWFQDIAWPLSKKPLIHTLAEFLGTFEAGLKDEGLFPARLQPLWDAYKRRMDRFEK